MAINVMKTLVLPRKCRCRSNPNALRARRGGEIAGWLLSAATLVMMPKCPACLAAYVAVATGIGISFPTATCLRIIMIAACTFSMAYLAAKSFKRYRVINRPASS
jgi:hypothetical protein